MAFWPAPADSSAHVDQSMTSPRHPRAARDRATGQDVGADSEWSRLSHLGPAGLVANERAAAVEAAAEAPSQSARGAGQEEAIDERGWACDHAHGAGMLGTDEGDNAVVLTDGLRAN